MIDCKHADNRKPFTPCELADMKPCRPVDCAWREPLEAETKGGDNHGLQARNEERRT